MMNRSIVTTDVAVCFTKLRFLAGTSYGAACHAARGVVSRIDLEAVRVISPPQALPNVMERESFALCELLHVSQLVQEKLRIESGIACKKDRTAKRNCSDSRLAEQNAADAQRQSTSPISQIAQLRPSDHQVVRQFDSSFKESMLPLREISQFSPPASYVIRFPSLCTTIVPARSVRTICAPAR